jgi:hypothetical protein
VIGAATVFYLWRPASTAYFKAQSLKAEPR